MSEARQFRQYAQEALRWAAASTTEKEKAALLDLARTWMQAATASEPPSVGANYRPSGLSCSPTDHHAAG
jgi:hypothetical protein